MSEDQSSDAREGSRDAMLLLTILRDVQGKKLNQAIIRNLSNTGMLAEGSFRVTQGQIVRFDLRNIGEMSGEIVRVEQDHVGIRFHREIDPLLTRKPVGGASVRKP